jgi:hypothetical protein
MSESSERLSAPGYTRESVDSYRAAAAAERDRLQRDLAAAKARTQLARDRARWLEASVAEHDASTPAEHDEPPTAELFDPSRAVSDASELPA